MHRFWFIPISVLTGLLALQLGCRQDNGISENGDPVNHAQKEKSPTQKNKAIIDRLKKTSKANSSESLEPAILVDKASTLALDFTPYRDAIENRYFFPEVMGAGIGFVDYDQDGFWDLYVGNGDALVGPSIQVDQVFRNHGGKQFENVTENLGGKGKGFAQGIAVGDFNADGFDDIFVANYGQNFLLANLGDGSFDKRLLGDSSQEPAWTASCIALDVDGDGDLDIVAASYLDWTVENHHPCTYKGVLGYCGPGTYAGTSDLVYLNNGDGSFIEAHNELGLNQETKGLVVCAADFDGDRIPEIYIGSDLTKNVFYNRRPGQKVYKEIASDAGVATSKNGQNEATMGLAVRDFDQDQRPDLFLTHYYKNKNTLYLNEGDLLFKDASFETRIKALSFDFIGFGTVPIDYDNDSDFDLFISNGHVLGESVPPFRLTPQLLNNENCRFYDVSSRSGVFFKKKFAGRSVASCDIDNDGDVDIAMGSLDEPLSLLENSTATENTYIQIQLQDWQRRDLTGTSAIVKIGSKSIHLPVVKGESYLACVDPRLHVGTKDAQSVSVTVRWSFGDDSEFSNLETNSSWLLGSSGKPVKLR